MTEEYEIKFRCLNCLEIFSKRILKGHTAEGNAGTCPECGCDENTVVRGTGQKLGRFPVSSEEDKSPEQKTFELLLEKMLFSKKGA